MMLIVLTNYQVSLKVNNVYGCSSEITKNINVIEPAGIPYVSASPSIGCDSIRVRFKLHNVDFDTIYSIIWNFNNEITDNSTAPENILFKNITESKKSFPVMVNINDRYMILYDSLITVYRTVKAFFECKDSIVENNKIVKSCYHLDKLFDSESTYKYLWEVNDMFFSSNPRISIESYNIPDTVKVKLTVINNTYGCINEWSARQFFVPDILVPNVFTPNDDGINDYFIIDPYGTVDLEVKIFSRTGLLVFKSKGKKIIWNGLTENGETLPEGIYYYTITPLDKNDNFKRYNKSGFVYLLR